MTAIETISFEKAGVRFAEYRYPPASVYPAGLVPYASIREVLPDQAPPEIRTRDGEVLFVSAVLKKQLLAAARKHRLSIVSRVDVWGLILEPFLDTKWDDVKALAILESNGVSKAECAALRESLRDAMYAYNIESRLWDWTHLGLADVLDALLENGPFRVCHKHALSAEAYRAFYHRAMEIAERGGLKTSPSHS